MIVHDNAGLLPDLIDYTRILRDAKLVQNGAVSFRVFWERYWAAVLIAGFIVLVFLSWLRRLLFGRPQIIIKEGKSRSR